MSISDLKDKIDELKNERATIDVETDPEAAEALDELINKCESEYYMRLNVATDGSLDRAVSIILFTGLLFSPFPYKDKIGKISMRADNQHTQRFLTS